MHRLITLTGRSGCGKSSVESELTKRGLKRVISHTSRTPRHGEVDGVNYYYLSQEEMEKMNEQELFAEYTEYNNNYYGASIEEVSKSDILVIEPIGLKKITKSLQDKDIKLIKIFLDISEEKTIERMKTRGDEGHKIVDRVVFDRKRFGDPMSHKVQSTYDFIISSDNTLESIVNEIYDIYNSCLDKDKYEEMKKIKYRLYRN